MAELCGDVLPADVDVMGKERVCVLETHGAESEHEAVPDGGLRIRWRPSDQPAPPTADFDEEEPDLPDAWRGRPWPKEPKSWGMDPAVEDEWRRHPDTWRERRTG